MSDNKAAFRRLVDATNTHDGELIAKTADELCHPDVLIRTPMPIRTSGPRAIAEIFGNLHRAFPDLVVTIEDLIEEDDKVVARQTVTGTHRGEYLGVAPTGNSITYDEIFVFRFENGRVAETWGVVDVLAQMRQLGLVPA